MSTFTDAQSANTVKPAYGYHAALEKWGAAAIENTFLVSKLGNDLRRVVVVAVGAATGDEAKHLREAFFAKVKTDISKAVGGRPVNPLHICQLSWLAETGDKRLLKVPVADALYTASLLVEKRKGCEDYRFKPVICGTETVQGDKVAQEVVGLVVGRSAHGEKLIKSVWEQTVGAVKAQVRAKSPTAAKVMDAEIAIKAARKEANEKDRLIAKAEELGLAVGEVAQSQSEEWSYVVAMLLDNDELRDCVLVGLAEKLGLAVAGDVFQSALNAAIPQEEPELQEVA